MCALKRSLCSRFVQVCSNVKQFCTKLKIEVLVSWSVLNFENKTKQIKKAKEKLVHFFLLLKYFYRKKGRDALNIDLPGQNIKWKVNQNINEKYLSKSKIKMKKKIKLVTSLPNKRQTQNAPDVSLICAQYVSNMQPTYSIIYPTFPQNNNQQWPLIKKNNLHKDPNCTFNHPISHKYKYGLDPANWAMSLHS